MKKDRFGKQYSLVVMAFYIPKNKRAIKKGGSHKEVSIYFVGVDVLGDPLG